MTQFSGVRPILTPFQIRSVSQKRTLGICRTGLTGRMSFQQRQNNSPATERYKWFIDHFSGLGGAVGPVCLWLCLQTLFGVGKSIELVKIER